MRLWSGISSWRCCTRTSRRRSKFRSHLSADTFSAFFLIMADKEEDDLSPLEYCTIVEIHDLNNAPQYNGRRATIFKLPSDKAKNKYGLCLKKGKQLLCPRKNLRVTKKYWIFQTHQENNTFFGRNGSIDETSFLFRNIRAPANLRLMRAQRCVLIESKSRIVRSQF